MRRCAHCGGKSSETWSARLCAVGRKASYRLCGSCDVELNRMVLDFFRDPNAASIINSYAEKKGIPQ